MSAVQRILKKMIKTIVESKKRNIYKYFFLITHIFKML